MAPRKVALLGATATSGPPRGHLGAGHFRGVVYGLGHCYLRPTRAARRGLRLHAQ